MTITLVIQIITSSFPRVASRKKYMKLDVKGAFLSYLLILLLLFFLFFSLYYALIMLYCVDPKLKLCFTFLKIYSFYVFTKK